MARKPTQRTFGFKRPKKRGRPRATHGLVPHVRRNPLSPRYPVHVNWKVLPGIWNLQTRKLFRALLPSFQQACDRNGVRLTHYSVQANHVHVIAEAADQRSLSQAMKGLAVRLAKAANRLMGRKGQVFADRFHETVLTNPTQAFNAIKYVLGNTLNHARRLGIRTDLEHLPDPYSAGPQHDVGWRYFLGEGPPPVAEPQTWLLRVGWTLAQAASRPAMQRL